MINIPFYTTEERVPKNQEEILVLIKTSSFGIEGFNTRHGPAEYYFDELDKDGNPTGTSSVYDESKDPKCNHGEVVLIDGISHKLRWSFDGISSEDIAFWTPIDEYWNALDSKE